MTRQPKPTDKEKPCETAVSSSGLIVESRKSATWSGVVYQLQRRGPKSYWYAFYHHSGDGKTRSKYIGKNFRELRADEF